MTDVWKCPWCGGEMTEAHPMCAEAARDEADRSAALTAERDALKQQIEAEAEVCWSYKAERDALAGKLAIASQLLQPPAGQVDVTPDYIQNAPETDWPKWLCGDTSLVPLSQLRAEQARADALAGKLAMAVEALRDMIGGYRVYTYDENGRNPILLPVEKQSSWIQRAHTTLAALEDKP